MMRYFWCGLVVLFGVFVSESYGAGYAPTLDDDIGWFGDVGLGTGLAYRISNHVDCPQSKLDPFPAIVFGFGLDYAGQKISRGEDLFDNRHASRAEGEQLLVGGISVILTASISLLIDEIDRSDRAARRKQK